MVHGRLQSWVAGRWRLVLQHGDELFLNFGTRQFELHVSRSDGAGMARGRFESVVECRVGEPLVWVADFGPTSWEPGTVVSIESIDADERFRDVLATPTQSRAELLRDIDRFAVVGPLDGDLHSSTRLIDVISDRGIHHLVQCGGFGFANSSSDLVEARLYALDVALYRADVRLWFIDGPGDETNHLRRFPRDSGGIRHVTERISFLPRGFRTTVRWVELAALGGEDDPRADATRMRPVDVLAPVLVEEDLAALGRARSNVLVTSDLPSGTRRTPAVGSGAGEAGRLVQRALEQTRPDVVFHGHSPAPFDRTVTIDSGDDRAFTYRAIALDVVTSGERAVCWAEVDLTAWRWDRAIRLRLLDGTSVPPPEAPREGSGS